MSPELFRPETKLSDIENKQVDIWALGVLAYELFFGKRPFEAFSIEELSKMYDRGTFEIDLESTKDKTISKQFFNFLNMCLQKDPKKRANLAKLKDSDFLNYHINSLEKMDGIKFDVVIDMKNTLSKPNDATYYTYDVEISVYEAGKSKVLSSARTSIANKY